VVPTREWLESELRTAILTAYEKDKLLLGSDASERSIMFRIGHYLAPAIEERWRYLSVDLEYNRRADEMAKKRVRGLGSDPNKQRFVFPDLIVHDRTSKDNNILIVEAKKTSADVADVQYDYEKLKAYKQYLMYQYAVYIEFGTQPRWQWFETDRELRSVAGSSA
jgi:hypothetical protein